MQGDQFIMWIRAVLFLQVFAANVDDFSVELSHLKM